MITTINNLIYDRNGEKRQALIKGFPLSLRKDALVVISLIKFTDYPIYTKEEVIVNNEALLIPRRVYFKKIPTYKEGLLTEQQKLILTCIYSRHCDGYIREEMLRKLSGNINNFTIPYVVQLLSEYVIELFPIINNQINASNIEEYHKFYKSNQSYFKKIEQRIMSYWEVYYGYYRGCKKSDYIGFQILNRIKFYGTNKL